MENFIKVNIEYENFDGQDLSEVIFDRCNLYHCSFKGCKMVMTVFSHCNVIACDFTDVVDKKIIDIKSNFIDKEDEDKMIHPEVEETEVNDAGSENEASTETEAER